MLSERISKTWNLYKIICHYRNKKKWVANRREYKDLIVNKEKMKNIKNEITSFRLSFLRDLKREEQKKEERKEEKKKRKKKEEKKKRKKEEKSKRYGFLWVFMDYFGYLYRFLWCSWTLLKAH